MEFLAPASQGGGLQPFLSGALPPGVLDASIGGLSVADALESFTTGHGEFYAGLLFVVFVLYVPNGLVGALRERYGNPLAPLVGDRLRGLLARDR